MRITEIDFDGQPPVDAYGPGFFRVRGEVHDGPVLVGPDGALAWAGLPDMSGVVMLAGQVDVVLIGTGPEISPLEPAVRRELADAGIGVEFMATPTACRTYNLLLGEGRRVVLVAIPV